jgi:hypothetical protein
MVACSGVPSNSQFDDIKLFKTRVIGKDDRREVNSSEAPQVVATATVDNEAEVGTGLIFGSACNSIMTSAHVYFSKGQQIADWSVVTSDPEEFSNAMTFKSNTLDFGSTRTWIVVDESGKLVSSNRHMDFAFARIPDDPSLGYGEVLSACDEFKEMRQLKQGDFKDKDLMPVKMVAFHGLDDGSEKKMEVINCNLRKKENPNSSHFNDDKLFYHDCDTNGMASGGVIYVEDRGVKYVVGMHVGNVFPVNPDGSVKLSYGDQLSSGKYYPEDLPLDLSPDGTSYNEMTHAGVMISMWGDPTSPSKSPAALWKKLF